MTNVSTGIVKNYSLADCENSADGGKSRFGLQIQQKARLKGWKYIQYEQHNLWSCFGLVLVWLDVVLHDHTVKKHARTRMQNIYKLAPTACDLSCDAKHLAVCGFSVCFQHLTWVWQKNKRTSSVRAPALATWKHPQGAPLDVHGLRLLQPLLVQELPEDVEHHLPAQRELPQQVLLFFGHYKFQLVVCDDGTVATGERLEPSWHSGREQRCGKSKHKAPDAMGAFTWKRVCVQSRNIFLEPGRIGRGQWAGWGGLRQVETVRKWKPFWLPSLWLPSCHKKPAPP